MRSARRLVASASASARSARPARPRLNGASVGLRPSHSSACASRVVHTRASTYASAPQASASASASHAHPSDATKPPSASVPSAGVVPGTHTVLLERTLPLSLGGIHAGGGGAGPAHLAAPLRLNLFDSAAEDLDGRERALQKPVILVCPSMSHSALVTRGEATRAREDKAAAAAAAAGGAANAAAAASVSPGPKGWWEGVVGRGPSFGIDLSVFRVVCASALGAPFGTTSPLTLRPDAEGGSGGRAYRADFPLITPLDQARMHAFLLDHLGVARVHAVVGSSMGGMAALQFARLYPQRYERVVAICTTAQSSASTQALRAVQRAAVRSDPQYLGGDYADRGDGAGPVHGMAIARMFGTICYRSREEFDHRFDAKPRAVALQCAASKSGEVAARRSAAAAVAAAPNPVAAALATTSPDPSAAAASSSAPSPAAGGAAACPPLFEVESYLQHAAASFTGRYDANCYLTLSTCMDLMDIAQPPTPTQTQRADAAETATDGDSHSASPPVLRASYDHGCSQIPSSKQVLLLPIGTDALIPAAELERLGAVLGGQGGRVHVERVHSLFGHDAFLKDHHTFNPRFAAFLDPKHTDGVMQVRRFVNSLMG